MPTTSVIDAVVATYGVATYGRNEDAGRFPIGIADDECRDSAERAQNNMRELETQGSVERRFWPGVTLSLDTLSRHGWACPGHPDPVRRCAFAIGIPGRARG